ncbi:hypothetical protein [Neoaquamicrobium sediminum]|uniref:hypothetical protein n=1 Tax=Neoaquamicrobium sediminum TaxID=1849104 RepID=UPI003BA857D5
MTLFINRQEPSWKLFHGRSPPTLRRRRLGMRIQHLPILAPSIRSISATRNFPSAVEIDPFDISVVQPAKFLKSPLHDKPEQSRFISHIRP